MKELQRNVLRVVIALGGAGGLLVGAALWNLLPTLPAKPRAHLSNRVRDTVLLASRGSVTPHLARVHLAKLPREKTFKYQLRGLALAGWLAVTWTREERVDAYAEWVWTGDERYGLEAGARHLFGQGVEDLGPDHLALLIAMLESPRRLDPRCHPKRARAARDALLERMRAGALLTIAEEQQARGKPLGVAGGCVENLTPPRPLRFFGPRPGRRASE